MKDSEDSVGPELKETHSSMKSVKDCVCTWDRSSWGNDETASSTSSLGSRGHNEFNESSGYNSPTTDGQDVKCKVGGETFSAGGVDGEQPADGVWDEDDCARFYNAVRIGDSEKVDELLGQGAIADIDEPNWNVSGDPPLLVAATNDHCFQVLR